MNFNEKICQLREVYDSLMRPLIDSDYVLIDVPYHGNIGDTLIWQGERDYLATIPHRMLEEASFAWRGESNIGENTIILFHGGGNFGDLYRYVQQFRLRIVQKCKKNKIIFLPQSVWYDNEDNIKKDAKILSQHPNVTLCARDAVTYSFFKTNFPKNNVILVPDSAFCINEKKLETFRNKAVSDRQLYVRRLDKELLSSTPQHVPNSDSRDWPTIEKTSWSLRFIYYSNKIIQQLPKSILAVLLPILNKYCQSALLKKQVDLGLGLIGGYKHVVTTRLHALITSVLLHKDVEYLDNSTGKLSAFVDTWLKDLDAVKQYK